MQPKEKQKLEAIYSKWTTEQLAKASTLEKNDYRPEALEIMLAELAKRGQTADSAAAIAISTPPPIPGKMPERETWLFPLRLNRRRYVIRSAYFIMTLASLFTILGYFTEAESYIYYIIIVAAIIYSALGLLLPRSREAGMSPTLAIIIGLFPITAFLVFITLFFVPSKKTYQK